MNKNLPVYAISDFREFSGEGRFYANDAATHVKQHGFTRLPHKHDFYFMILFTQGKGTHEIDFESYKVMPGSLFILRPGQMHYWDLSANIDGYVFFHTKEFYEEAYTSEKLANYAFFNSFQGQSHLLLRGNVYEAMQDLMLEIAEEYADNKPFKFTKIHTLVTLCYITLARRIKPILSQKKQGYMDRLRQFEDLLDRHYKVEKSAAFYADGLNMSEKHLNRILKTCLNKTTSQLIAERIILEAKRLLVQGKLNILETGTELGYPDKSYFSRFFKKNCGETPTAFLERYR